MKDYVIKLYNPEDTTTAVIETCADQAAEALEEALDSYEGWQVVSMYEDTPDAYISVDLQMAFSILRGDW